MWAAEMCAYFQDVIDKSQQVLAIAKPLIGQNPLVTKQACMSIEKYVRETQKLAGKVGSLQAMHTMSSVALFEGTTFDNIKKECAGRKGVVCNFSTSMRRNVVSEGLIAQG